MIRTRNLICHIFPLKRGQKWRNTVAHILRRWNLFNGKKIIALALNPDCDEVDTIKAAFGAAASQIEWLVFSNHPCLREVLSFTKMLERVESLNPEEATLCCHGKGSTHGHDDSICHCWAELMWITCCDSATLVDCMLRDHAICGAFRTQDSSVGSPWHFRGTFYWVRHDKTFSRDWRRINQDYVGTESWPGVQFSWEESACLFMDHPQSLYDETFWEGNVFPAFQYWRERLRAHGVFMTDYSPPDWFLARHPNFRMPTGLSGSAMTAREKRSWPRIPASLRHAFSFSRK